MSYLLIKKGGQQPSKGPPTNRNNGHRRNNPTLSSVQRRPGGVGGGSSQSWRNPSSARNGASNHHHPHNDGGTNQIGIDASNQQRRHGVAIVNDGGGQVQLQRTAPLVQRQQQVTTATQQQVQQSQGQQQQQKVVQGLVSMDEVYADLQILEQQRQESERKLASARLLQKQKKAEQNFLESKLCELKSRNGGLRVELERYGNQLSFRHRELLETQMKAENSRKDTHRFDAKLKRVIGVARLLGTYRNKIENAMIALNETVTRLNFAKGQEISKLQSALLRRDDARRRRDLLQKAINANTVKGRSIAEEISKIRAEIGMNEQDLSAAQQMESQTKLRVETIEHEVMMERTRHADAAVNLELESKELDESKDKTTRLIADKKAMIETKKSELRKIWEKCTELRKSEGHDVFPEPTWGTEQAPSLDVARVRVRVDGEEAGLKAMTSKRETLRKDVADLDALVGSNTINSAEKRAKADALQKDAEKTRAEQSLRIAEITKAVEDADLACQEAEKLRNSIQDLTTTQEKDATDLKLILEDEERSISTMEAEIACSLDELASINTQSAEHKENERVKNDKLLKEIAGAKTTAALVKTAFERAQKNANSFSALPDRELDLQMKLLDESEQEIVDVATRERDEIIETEPLLEKLKLDFHSDVSMEERKEAGIKYLRTHCLDFLETAKIERQVRMEHARDAYLEKVRLREQEEAQRKKEKDELEEESRLAEESRLREEEEEEEERRREEERAASIVTAKNERKKEEAKRREERRAAAKAAEIERKREKEAEAKRRREEEEAGERRREEERAASIVTAKNERKKEERRAAAKAAEIEREQENEMKAKSRREEEEVERRRKKEETTAASAVTASSKADHKGEEHSSKRCERDGKGIIVASKLQHQQESQKKLLAAEAADKAKRRQEREKRRELELEEMRVHSKKMQEQLKAEEDKHEDLKRKENNKQSADRKRREDLQSRKSSLEMKDFDDIEKKINGDAKKRARKSYSQVEALKLNRPAKSDKFHEEQVRDETVDGVSAASEHKSKRAKSSEAVPSSKRNSSSGLAKSAIKLKDSRLPKPTSSVRFDTTADRPKLDIFTSGVHRKENNHAKKKSSNHDKFSSSKPGSQTSGISSCEAGGGGRRRKKSSVGGKSKANVLAMKGFDDNGGFL